MPTVASPTTYFLANRVWWAVALLIGPIAGAISGEPLVGVAVIGLLVLPSFLIFDTERSWWSGAVRRLPEEPKRTRSETRKLTLWSAIALLTGLAIAFMRPWA